MSSSFFSLGCFYSVLPHDLSIKASENSFFLSLDNLSPSLHGACEQVVNFKYCIIVIASLVHVLTYVLTIGTFYDMELIIRKEEKKKKRCVKPEVNCNKD